MQKDISLKVSPSDASDLELIKKHACEQEQIVPERIHSLRIIRRSTDARQRQVWINLTVRLFIDEDAPDTVPYKPTHYPDVSDAPQAVVVGAGPGGLFASLRLIELGVRPILLERGKEVMERLKDIMLIKKEQKINPESNYCFGEGGAGAFSDGKLYTRSKKRGSVEKILNVFCQHGASDSILVDAHPHIGTNKLPLIVKNLREQIKASGGMVHFSTRVDSLIIENNEVKGVETNTGEKFFGPVILATGHSARDIYYMLDRQNVKIEAKGLAVGVRIEHPSHLIDQIQYHNPEGRGEYLPAAEYSFVVQAKERGVYSFCMCPGGFIVPAASSEEQLVVNGMSPANRGSKWSNSGVVVQVNPGDFPEYDKFGALSLLKFQEDIEHRAWVEGGCKQTAPAQRMYDFVNKKVSESLPSTSYTPGVVSSPLHEWLPTYVTSRLREAFIEVGKKQKGYLTNDALLHAVESRTSSPVRVVRNRETLEHEEMAGLYPCGEGAGYAGGIVSAAMDGENCAEALAEKLTGIKIRS
ncbi:MAG: FAD-binding protein [Bacteroidales bacterium 45-6]|nr:MAG: FAD-binding protein [Bacteroidales bacterium 45-6]